MSENQLPWVGHKKDTDKFDFDNHTLANCKCGYHKNKLNKNLKLNTQNIEKYINVYEQPRKLLNCIRRTLKNIKLYTENLEKYKIVNLEH